MKGCKTIAEYVIKKWMEDNGFAMDEFFVEMNGNAAMITDKRNDSIEVYYNSETKSVDIKE